MKETIIYIVGSLLWLPTFLQYAQTVCAFCSLV